MWQSGHPDFQLKKSVICCPIIIGNTETIKYQNHEKNSKLLTKGIFKNSKL